MKETRFKDTEIGRIPEDWSISFIGDECSVNTGSKNTQDKIENGKYPFYVRSQEIERINSYSYDCEAVLTAGDGVGTGKVFHYINGKFEVHQRVYIMNNFSDRLVGEFFYRYFSQNFYNRINQMTAKSSVDSVRKEMITKMYISFPSKEEQSRIASALTSVDNLISSLDKLIEKKKNIKQGTMQQLLTGKKRLKGFAEPWVEKKINEIGELTGAGVDKLSRPDETPIRLLNYLDVFHRDHIYNSELKMWVTANEQKLNKCNVCQGDVFFTPSSEMPYDIALSAVAMEDMKDVCYSYHIYRLRFNEELDLKYKAYMFKSQKFYNQANLTCEGSGKRYVISLSKFRELTVCYPQNIAEQSAIASILTSMDKEISSLESKKAKYESMKQGMMQQLLTGKIRLI